MPVFVADAERASRSGTRSSGPSFCAIFSVPTLDDSASTPVAVNFCVGWYHASLTVDAAHVDRVGHA